LPFFEGLQSCEQGRGYQNPSPYSKLRVSVGFPWVKKTAKVEPRDPHDPGMLRPYGSAAGPAAALLIFDNVLPSIVPRIAKCAVLMDRRPGIPATTRLNITSGENGAGDFGR
jgi:hypothetical protein